MSTALAVPTLAAQRRQILRNDQLTVRSDLNGAQVGLEVGQAIPIVFGRRVDGAGGVWISPPATECRFENDIANQVTASYQLVLSDGQVGTLAEGDVYQGDTPLTAAEFEQNYNARAESWAPGNFIEQRFNVTASNQIYSVEGKAIGGANLDLGSMTDAEIQEEIEDAKAEITIKSSGNYVTSFSVTIDKPIVWPRSGVKIATRGSGATGISFGTSTGGTSGVSLASATDIETLPWYVIEDNPTATSFRGVAETNSPPSLRPWYPAGQVYTVGNGWIYERGDDARFLARQNSATAAYELTRPASLEPYGDIELELKETIRPGFVLKEPIPGVGLFGGLPPVRYDITVLEINSEPLPRPEATLYTGTGGTYAGLSTLSVVKEYPSGDDRWQRQVHAFVREGVAVPRLIEGTSGASNQYPDLARRLMVASARVPAALIDEAQLLAAAQFCAAQGLLCDGLIANPTNLREWLDRTAPLFLLKPSNRWGKLGLRPAVATTGSAINTSTITPEMVLDESNSEGFSYTYRPRADRQPFAALVLWREQPENDVGQLRSTEVRYVGQAVDGPFEETDASEFVTREAHAMRIGAYRLAVRRHVTHDASITVLSTAAANALMPGDVVRVNRARNPSIGSPTVWSYLYEINTISGPPLGPWRLELTHFPVDVDGRSLVARDVANAAIITP